ncbi:unnamed protein product [Miscanthus lutarioriparius]|uniref:Carboxypeptidase n=1 Tax=Miscanthus lutarioriparius TaxID=422564 RepID=A0A811QQU5_9POAL|nr:unnamed protein product [Miscanthus lutarioriparius]
MATKVAPMVLCLFLFLSTAGASSAPNSSSPVWTGTPDGSMRWGYAVPRPELRGKAGGVRSTDRCRAGGSSVGRGNFLEIGPLYITMQPRPCTWLHVSDLIFVDAPVGVGFSYADEPSLLVKTDKQAVSDLLGVIQELIRRLPSLQSRPLYLVGESYGGKFAAMLGVVLERAIRDGTMKLTLGGVVIGDGWISPADNALSYGDLLHTVLRLNDNAVSRVNKMGLTVEQQMAAGQFAAAQKTWTDQLDLIDSQSDGVNIFNFLLDIGMNPVLSSSLLMASQSALSNNTDDIINRVFKPFLRIIPKKVLWEEATLQVYEELKNDFMKPAVREVDELLALGVSVTVYNGQYDVIVPAIGTEAWVKKLEWNGLNHFLSLPRHPLHYCNSIPEHCSQQIRAYVRAYEKFTFYWILGAGHMVPVDQPYPALRMIANITQSPGNIDDVTCY